MPGHILAHSEFVVREAKLRGRSAKPILCSAVSGFCVRREPPRQQSVIMCKRADENRMLLKTRFGLGMFLCQTSTNRRLFKRHAEKLTRHVADMGSGGRR